MENFASRTYKLDVDLSFTPFSSQDLDTVVETEVLELLKNSRAFELFLFSNATIPEKYFDKSLELKSKLLLLMILILAMKINLMLSVLRSRLSDKQG